MTNLDRLTVLRAAFELWYQNGLGVTYGYIAARFGVDEELSKLELLPLVSEYFEKVLPGDDGVVSLRQPTAEARRLVGL